MSQLDARVLPGRPRLLSSLGLALLALGCGRSDSGGMAAGGGAQAADTLLERSLLAQEPESKREDLGRVAPDMRTGWGPGAVGAWAKSAEEWRDGRLMMLAYDVRSGVVLPANERAERKIEVWLSGPLGARSAPDSVPARLHLNGIQLGEVELGPAPQLVAIEAPLEAWVEGDNLFEVQVQRTYPGGVAPAAFSMGEVRYGEPRVVTADLGARSLSLPTGTAATYRIEPLGSGELWITGLAEFGGADELLVSLELAPVNLVTGDPDASAAETFEALLTPGDEALSHKFELDRGGAPLELSVSVRGPAEAALQIESLVLKERAEEPPNVIWIAIDTLSARHLELYGYGRDTAPNITRFAEEAVVFERCWTNAPWTLTSFFASLSGMYPSSHDIDQDPTKARSFVSMWERRTLAPNRWTLAEALRAGGWRTGAFVDHTWLVESYGVHQGFEVFDHTAGWIVNTDREHGFTSTLAAGLEWNDALDADQRRFLFVHGFDVHGPYASLPEWRDKVAEVPRPDPVPADMPASGLTKAFDIIPDYVTRAHAPAGSKPDRMDPGPIVDAYDGGIAEVDAKLGRFFTDLEERGLLENSVVVIFADHGESMVQHHRPFGHGTMHEEVSHVPLIVRLPGGKHGGRRITDQVQLVDLPPTILELCGLEPDREVFHGRSLVPLIEGEDQPLVGALCEGGGLDQQAFLYDGWKLIRQNPLEGEVSMRLTYPRLDPAWTEEFAPELVDNGLTKDRMRTIEKRFGSLLDLDRALRGQLSGRYVELYHLAEDPREQVDLAAEMPEKVAELEALMERELARAGAARRGARVLLEPPTLDETMLDALEAAGYVDR